MGTIHPHINTTLETPMRRNELEILLAITRDAIRDGDHKKLYEMITKVAEGVSDIVGSSDVFIRQNETETYKVVQLPLSNQK